MRLLFFRRSRRGERGIAMVAVLVALSITLVMVMVTLTYVTGSVKYSRYEQDAERALAAAESGVNDLLTEFRVDPTYLAHIDATKADPDGYCNKDATGGPAADMDIYAAVCGWDPDMAARFQQLGEDQAYHYAIVSSADLAESIEVVSTGRSRDVYRSVKARLSRETPTMWLWLTDYELSDPNDALLWPGITNGFYPAGQLTSEECGWGWAAGATPPGLHYAWDSYPFTPASDGKFHTYQSALDPANPRYCDQARFGLGDELDGPVHSNDAIYAVEGKVYDQLSSSNPECKNVDPTDNTTWDRCVVGDVRSTGAPVIGHFQWLGPAPSYRRVLDLPTTQNAKVKAVDDGVGCAYAGPTRIILDGDEMIVWSKETTVYRDGCGSLAALASPSGARVDVPEEGLIYVGPATGVPPTKIHHGAIGDGLPLGNYEGQAPTPYAEYIEEWVMELPEMYDGIGNLWIEGHFTGGNLTIAADRIAVITGDLLQDNDDQDLIGVMAGQRIEIYNPMVIKNIANAAGTLWRYQEYEMTEPDSLPYTYVGTGLWPRDYDGRPGLRIEAAIYATSGSFGLQNWDIWGELGDLEVFGSIAQRFRGIMGSYDDNGKRGGYNKKYKYNKRLTEAAPLLFPPISNGVWRIAWQGKADPLDAVTGG
ncbi:MAG: DinB family protein [Bifidobacteriaceae bacterium]|nr:DinB family protein [Bifidobacteriaceae bacterium]